MTQPVRMTGSALPQRRAQPSRGRPAEAPRTARQQGASDHDQHLEGPGDRRVGRATINDHGDGCRPMARPRERTAGRIDSTADRWPGSAFFRYQITDLHLVTASG